MAEPGSSEVSSLGSDPFASVLESPAYQLTPVSEANQGHLTKYRELCRDDLGENYDFVPEEFKLENLPISLRRSQDNEIVQADPLCKLPICDGILRRRLALLLSDALLKDQNVGFLVADVDQLKVANDIFSRDLGDLAIKYSAAHLLQEIEVLNLTAKVVATKGSRASDETYMFFFGLTDSDTDKLRELESRLNQEKKAVDLPDNQGRVRSYNFSSSLGFIDSKAAVFASDLVASKSWLNQLKTDGQPIPPAYNFLNSGREAADITCHAIKSYKEKAKYPDLSQQDAQKSLAGIVDKYGGGRIDAQTLTYLLLAFAQKYHEEAATGQQSITISDIDKIAGR